MPRCRRRVVSLATSSVSCDHTTSDGTDLSLDSFASESLSEEESPYYEKSSFTAKRSKRTKQSLPLEPRTEEGSTLWLVNWFSSEVVRLAISVLECGKKCIRYLSSSESCIGQQDQTRDPDKSSLLNQKTGHRKDGKRRKNEVDSSSNYISLDVKGRKRKKEKRAKPIVFPKKRVSHFRGHLPDSFASKGLTTLGYDEDCIKDILKILKTAYGTPKKINLYKVAVNGTESDSSKPSVTDFDIEDVSRSSNSKTNKEHDGVLKLYKSSYPSDESQQVTTSSAEQGVLNSNFSKSLDETHQPPEVIENQNHRNGVRETGHHTSVNQKHNSQSDEHTVRNGSDKPEMSNVVKRSSVLSTLDPDQHTIRPNLDDSGGKEGRSGPELTQSNHIEMTPSQNSTSSEQKSGKSGKFSVAQGANILTTGNNVGGMVGVLKDAHDHFPGPSKSKSVVISNSTKIQSISGADLTGSSLEEKKLKNGTLVEKIQSVNERSATNNHTPGNEMRLDSEKASNTSRQSSERGSINNEEHKRRNSKTENGTPRQNSSSKQESEPTTSRLDVGMPHEQSLLKKSPSMSRNEKPSQLSSSISTSSSRSGMSDKVLNKKDSSSDKNQLLHPSIVDQQLPHRAENSRRRKSTWFEPQSSKFSIVTSEFSAISVDDKNSTKRLRSDPSTQGMPVVTGSAAISGPINSKEKDLPFKDSDSHKKLQPSKADSVTKHQMSYTRELHPNESSNKSMLNSTNSIFSKIDSRSGEKNNELDVGHLEPKTIKSDSLLKPHSDSSNSRNPQVTKVVEKNQVHDIQEAEDSHVLAERQNSEYKSDPLITIVASRKSTLDGSRISDRILSDLQNEAGIPNSTESNQPVNSIHSMPINQLNPIVAGSKVLNAKSKSSLTPNHSAVGSRVEISTVSHEALKSNNEGRLEGNQSEAHMKELDHNEKILDKPNSSASLGGSKRVSKSKERSSMTTGSPKNSGVGDDELGNKSMNGNSRSRNSVEKKHSSYLDEYNHLPPPTENMMLKSVDSSKSSTGSVSKHSTAFVPKRSEMELQGMVNSKHSIDTNDRPGSVSGKKDEIISSLEKADSVNKKSSIADLSLSGKASSTSNAKVASDKDTILSASQSKVQDAEQRLQDITKIPQSKTDIVGRSLQSIPDSLIVSSATVSLSAAAAARDTLNASKVITVPSKSIDEKSAGSSQTIKTIDLITIPPDEGADHDGVKFSKKRTSYSYLQANSSTSNNVDRKFQELPKSYRNEALPGGPKRERESSLIKLPPIKEEDDDGQPYIRQRETPTEVHKSSRITKTHKVYQQSTDEIDDGFEGEDDDKILSNDSDDKNDESCNCQSICNCCTCAKKRDHKQRSKHPSQVSKVEKGSHHVKGYDGPFDYSTPPFPKDSLKVLSSPFFAHWGYYDVDQDHPLYKYLKRADHIGLDTECFIMKNYRLGDECIPYLNITAKKKITTKLVCNYYKKRMIRSHKRFSDSQMCDETREGPSLSEGTARSKKKCDCKKKQAGGEEEADLWDGFVDTEEDEFAMPLELKRRVVEQNETQGASTDPGSQFCCDVGTDCACIQLPDVMRYNTQVLPATPCQSCDCYIDEVASESSSLSTPEGPGAGAIDAASFEDSESTKNVPVGDYFNNLQDLVIQLYGMIDKMKNVADDPVGSTTLDKVETVSFKNKSKRI